MNASCGDLDRRLQPLLLTVWCVVLFFSSLFLFTRHNTFPVEFHADEVPKAEQVLERQPTFRQPLLLIVTTAFATRLGYQRDSVQQIVFTGRAISAVFGAGAVVLLSLFAYAVNGHGLRAAIAVGLAAGSCPHLLLLAHYMKEDTALVFAAALFLLATWYDEHKPDRASAILLGTAAALAASAKYVGLAAIPIGHWIISKRLSAEKGPRVREFILAVVLSWCAINYLVLLHPLHFLGSMCAELAHPVAGHRGLANAILFSSPVWRMLAAQVNLLVTVLAVIYLARSLYNRRTLPRATILFVLGTITYLVLLSASRFVLDRHLLPVTLAIYTMGGFAVVELTRLLRPPTGRWVATLVLSIVFIATGFSPSRAIYHELRHETRLQLRTWIQDNLPATAVIAQDRPAHLNISNPAFLAAHGQLRQKVLTPREFFVTDLGSLADLRAEGVSHIVTCDEAYGRLFTEHPTSAPVREDYNRRRARYHEIFSSATLLFEAKSVRPIGGSTSPVVRVYAIPSLPL
jgi:hypothetical protein